MRPSRSDIELTSITQGGNTIKQFGYDTAGRRTSMTEGGATTIYTWDMESRIKQITKSGVTTNTYAYNGLDARTMKTDSLGTNTFKRAGAGVTSPVIADSNATYTPGISEKRGGTSRYLHSGLKNADSQTDPGKVVTATRDYDAFGNVLTETPALSWKGPFGNAGGFGYQEDPDHGLKLLGHRYYDSSTGRFLSRDPAEDGRNWYTYCANMPTRSADPDGAVQVDLIWRPVVDVDLPAHVIPGLEKFGTTSNVVAYHCAIVITDNARGNTEPSYTFGGGRSADGKCYSISGPWATGTVDHDAATKHYKKYSNGNIPAVRLVDDSSPMLPMLINIAFWDNQMHDLNFPYFPIPYSDSNANSGAWAHELVRRMEWDDLYERAMRKRRKAGHGDLMAPGWGHRPPTFRAMTGLTL